MAITWGVRLDGLKRETSPRSHTVPYLLTGVADPVYAEQQALLRSPALSGDLFRTNVVLTKTGPSIWEVDVTYGTEEKKEPEENEYFWRFTAGGGTRHITQALDTAAFTPSGATPIDHDGAIGVRDDGEVEGVDVPDYKFGWSETHNLLLANYGWAYSNRLAVLAGHTNAGYFRGKDPGTVLLREASGGQSSKNPKFLEVTFTFEHSPDVYSFYVNNIPVTQKAGWDYLWVRYTATETADGKSKQTPRQVDVNRVITRVDFSQLGIGN